MQPSQLNICKDARQLFKTSECCGKEDNRALHSTFDLQGCGAWSPKAMGANQPLQRPYSMPSWQAADVETEQMEATVAYVVETVYKQYLGRLPTITEFTQWASALQQRSASLPQLETMILTSDEFGDKQRLPRSSSGEYQSAKLSNKCAVVTGGSSGIGFAAAVELAKAGVRVLVTSRSRDVFDEHVAIAATDGSYLYAKNWEATRDTWLSRCAAEDFNVTDCASRVDDFKYNDKYMVPTLRRHFYSGPINVPSHVLQRMQWYGVDHRKYDATLAMYNHVKDTFCGQRPDIVVVNPTTWSTPFTRPTSRPAWSTDPTIAYLSDEQIINQTPDRYTNTEAQTTQHNSIMFNHIVYAYHAVFGRTTPGVHFAFVGSPTAHWHPYGALFANEAYFRGKSDNNVLATQMRSQTATTGILVSQAFPYYLRSDMVYQDLIEQESNVEGGPLTWRKGYKGSVNLGVDRWMFHVDTRFVDMWSSAFKLGYTLPAQIIGKVIMRQLYNEEQSSLYVPNLPFTPNNRGLYGLFTYLPEFDFDATAVADQDSDFWVNATAVRQWSESRMVSAKMMHGTSTESFRLQTWTHTPSSTALPTPLNQCGP
jgi:NAD(P)-dependent dehydrogenase (short-subunit alcohol dehydrogenase family)